MDSEWWEPGGSLLEKEVIHKQEEETRIIYALWITQRHQQEFKSNLILRYIENFIDVDINRDLYACIYFFALSAEMA